MMSSLSLHSILGVCLPILFLALSGSAILADNFQRIVNVPPDVITDNETFDSTTQVNIGQVSVDSRFNVGSPDGTSTNVEVNVDGGRLRAGFDAFGDVTVNITRFGQTAFQAHLGTEVNVDGGLIGFRSGLHNGSVLNLKGGSVGPAFRATTRSVVNVINGDISSVFTASESTVNLAGGEIGQEFTATDGTIVNMTGGFIHEPFILSNESEANIYGGEIDKEFEVNGGTLNLFGGKIGWGGVVTNGGNINIYGGFVDKGLVAYSDSTINVLGGEVYFFLGVDDGGTLNVSGGVLWDPGNAVSGSEVNISGGIIRGGLRSSGEVNISGGSQGYLIAESGAELTLTGGEFRLNDELVDGLEAPGSTKMLDLPADYVVSGTFADGTPFAFSNQGGDTIADRKLTLVAADLPAIGPKVIHLPNDSAPRGIRRGQTLIVDEGGVVGDYFSAGRESKVIIRGGQVGRDFEAVGAEVIITGGVIEGVLTAFPGSTVEIYGGSIEYFRALERSEVNVFGRQFYLDGTDITLMLVPNVPFIIDNREGGLSGVLPDGSQLSLSFAYMSPDAILTVTLIPEPAGSLLLCLIVCRVMSIRLRYSHA